MVFRRGEQHAKVQLLWRLPPCNGVHVNVGLEFVWRNKNWPCPPSFATAAQQASQSSKIVELKLPSLCLAIRLIEGARDRP